jgi:hypothetical protein
MKLELLFVAVVATAVSCQSSGYGLDGRTLEIHMPRAKPEQPETYLCTPFKLSNNQVPIL